MHVDRYDDVILNAKMHPNNTTLYAQNATPSATEASTKFASQRATLPIIRIMIRRLHQTWPDRERSCRQQLPVSSAPFAKCLDTTAVSARATSGVEHGRVI